VHKRRPDSVKWVFRQCLARQVQRVTYNVSRDTCGLWLLAPPVPAVALKAHKSLPEGRDVVGLALRGSMISDPVPSSRVRAGCAAAAERFRGSRVAPGAIHAVPQTPCRKHPNLTLTFMSDELQSQAPIPRPNSPLPSGLPASPQAHQPAPLRRTGGRQAAHPYSPTFRREPCL
jgi:hypothetical protein